ncbi:Bbp19 family protein [Sphingobium sp. YG1]|uniref:Bbp19 family protein n=1 Tax=Sphingobium sp. YG1 TaxID=2082188 RepID=UPI000DBB4D00|nr:hypothetical protein [Sphingobium sp. YG1]BBC99102.1 hypothetical protein YGS_C1P0358 [Sphingobium sp. YG1]
MSETMIRNQKRIRAVLQSRAFKRLFLREAEIAEVEPDGVEVTAQRLFFGEGGLLKRDAEAVLADLRDYCRAQSSGFSPDPLIMAKMAGRREVWLRIMEFLNLDEKLVQTLMEVDDGY